jgi:hypothetical protein
MFTNDYYESLEIHENSCRRAQIEADDLQGPVHQAKKCVCQLLMNVLHPPLCYCLACVPYLAEKKLKLR